MRITHGFTDLPSDKFYDIWTQQHQSVSPCKLSEHNFENLTIRVAFPKPRKNCFKHFQVLLLQAVITPQSLQMPNAHGQMAPPPTKCLVSILPLESIQSLCPALYAAHQKIFPATFNASSDTNNFTIRCNVRSTYIAWPDYVVRSRPGHPIQ